MTAMRSSMQIWHSTKLGHAEKSTVPSAMLTSVSSSSIVTWPLTSQSPLQRADAGCGASSATASAAASSGRARARAMAIPVGLTQPSS